MAISSIEFQTTLGFTMKTFRSSCVFNENRTLTGRLKYSVTFNNRLPIMIIEKKTQNAPSKVLKMFKKCMRKANFHNSQL